MVAARGESSGTKGMRVPSVGTESGAGTVGLGMAIAIAAGIMLLAAAVIFVVHWILTHRLRGTPLADLARRCAPPAYLTAETAIVKLSLAGLATADDDGRTRLGERLLGGAEEAVQHLLLLVLIGAIGWLIIQLVRVFTAMLLKQFNEEHGADSARVKRARTQVMLVERVITAAAVVIAVGAMLFTWEQVRILGAGVLASAGIIGIIVGIAAQKAIGNLFAGLQLAFSDMVRVDDVVVVEGQWGQIEELTLSYVVIRIWDDRRLVLPVSYFTDTPFENWTKKDRSIIGSVYLLVDWTVPVPELREQLGGFLDQHHLWDRNDWALVVTDVTANGLVEIRATMGAANGFASWTLNCDVREWLVGYVREHYPEALPRMRAEITGDERRRPTLERTDVKDGDHRRSG